MLRIEAELERMSWALSFLRYSTVRGSSQILRRWVIRRGPPVLALVPQISLPFHWGSIRASQVLGASASLTRVVFQAMPYQAVRTDTQVRSGAT